MSLGNGLTSGNPGGGGGSGSGTVTSVTATDASVVVAGTATDPTIATGTLNAIATAHPPTAAVALNAQKITGLANGSGAQDAAAFGQIPAALPPNGSATGDLTGSYPAPTIKASVGLTGVPTAPTAAAGNNTTQIATDAFVTTAVNNAIAGVNPAIAVLAATTAAGDTSALTYANGASGVGATLTGSVNTPITIDGVSLNTLGQRLLVKNDTQSPSGAFNGIYSLTVVSSVGTAPVFTRALDYDTPSDINNTGAIPVTSGTANTTTSWVETAQIATVGTDALTFTKFTINPSNIVQSVAATDSTVTVAGTSTGPTVAVATGGVTNTQVSATAAIGLSKLADPGANKLVGDTDGGTTTGAVTVGSGLSLASGTLTASGSSLPSGLTAGDLLVVDSTNTLVRLPHGTAGQTLKMPPSASYFVAYSGAVSGTTGSDSGLPSGNPAHFSWTGIVNYTSTSNMWIWGYGTASGTHELGLQQQTTTTWRVASNAAGITTSWTITAINTGVNTHLGLTYDGTTWHLYINGVDQGGLTSSVTTPNVTLGNLWLAGDVSANTAFTGKSAYQAFWGSTTLTGAQVLAQYNAMTTGGYVSTVDSQVPTRFFQGQEASGTVAVDSGSSLINLTYSGSGVTLQSSGTPISPGVIPAWV